VGAETTLEYIFLDVHKHTNPQEKKRANLETWEEEKTPGGSEWRAH
jgi:hypothetical protein